METRHRVLILGGGFGGLYAAKALRKAPVELTVLDRRNFHLRQQNTQVLLGEAEDLDVGHRRVILDSGDLEYDTLIVATGSTDFYFGHDDWKRVAPGLKSIEEATEIRHKILYAFEAAEKEHDPEIRHQWLTFVLVGGGPTGVELAGALGEIAHDTLRRDFRSIRPQEAVILLVEGGPRVLPAYPEDLSAKAEASLTRLGVTVKTNTFVTSVGPTGVTVTMSGGEERIAARTVIWSAGVQASPFGRTLQKRAGAQLDRAGRVLVNPDCSVPGHPEIFVIGDLAHLEQDGTLLPGVAQVAMQQGGYVARLIQKRLRGEAATPFRYFDKGNLAVIGRAAAVAQIGPLHMSGLLAWITWLFVHLMYLVEFSNRVLVFIHWGFLYLTFDRGARLITGDDPLAQTAEVEEADRVAK
jgi:NADH dehydrogenase